MSNADWEAVRSAARGDRTDYRIDARRKGHGGQAEVFRAEHKPTGVPVAFKRLKHRSADSVARMRREIEVGSSIDHPNVMPVLDADARAAWFVMPLALDNLEARRDEVVRTSRVRELIEDICAGLAAAHLEGWIHRDVTPSNILLFPDPERWVVADWGLVRRPAGQTTAKGRTRAGVSYGTEGFAAPELSRDAHTATAAADVYSVGQLIGWCLSGTWPQQNVPLLPTEGPWRTVVRAATQHVEARRPQSLDALVQLIERVMYRPPDPPEVLAEALIGQITQPGEHTQSVDALLGLVEQHPDNEELCIDQLPRLPGAELARAVARSPHYGFAVVTVLDVENVGRHWEHRPYRWADQIILRILDIASAAAEIGELDLLDKAAAALFAWDGSWDQWPPQGPIRQWLISISGDAAGVVAQALVDAPDSARHFEEVASATRADRRIRDAIRRAI